MTFPAAKKSYGQHFLLEPRLNQLIARHALEGLKQPSVIELGAGSGALTKALLAHPLRQLIAIEYDKRMKSVLMALRDERLTVMIEDALTMSLDALTMSLDALTMPLDDVPCHRPVAVVGNLPYHIAVPLMMRFRHYGCARLTFVVQEEIAQRLVAREGNKHYGRVSVMAQLAWDIRLLRSIGRAAFHPPPQVKSRLLTMTPRAACLSSDEDALLGDVVRHLFSQRRKMVHNGLKDFDGDMNIHDVLAQAHIDGHCRPEQLSIETLCRLVRVMAARRSVVPS